MAITTYKGIRVPGATTDSISDGTTTIGGILIDNDKYLADHVKTLEDANGITIATTRSGLTTTVTFTCGDSSHSFTVNDGTSAVSPAIAVSALSTTLDGVARTGSTLTITDQNGTRTVQILNGVNGTNGFTPTVTLGTKVNGSQTLTIVGSSGTTTSTINDGVTGWTEGSLVDGSNTLTDGSSLYRSSACSSASISAGSSWSTGATARVGITFASTSTFSYPSGWKCVGDDCSSGAFTFVQGSSYWLTIECKPDYTWMTVIKSP